MLSTCTHACGILHLVIRKHVRFLGENKIWSLRWRPWSRPAHRNGAGTGDRCTNGRVDELAISTDNVDRSAGRREWLLTLLGSTDPSATSSSDQKNDMLCTSERTTELMM
ncbi:predicted protein [Coccidioides posadasii str. Silveira]|uniref:Predicted protein n=2 Tax=Coccidioides posadasii TaxID=199306 RepID=E9DFV5_COCPS|nr:predicted protein [Coccidioides posadasii str. Silveira]KMM63723.1 hypothetical protein CPAG_00077 [Coccidioides posadasii RMSCC 3488]